jgi:predicted alpha/beta-fold hydrolase
MNVRANYAAPWWLPGGQLQTLWPAICARRTRGAPVQYRRERWDTPDGDFIDVDWLVDDAPTLATACVALPQKGVQPLLVLFHGLEGSSASHYAQAFADHARVHGMRFAVPHFRGCSGEINRRPRAYHSGDYEEMGWVLKRLRQGHTGPMLAVGISLGGNALLRWAEEMGATASHTVAAIAAVCAPLDLTASGQAIGQGFNRQVYTRMFMQSMVHKALQKLAQFPGLFDRAALLAARDLYEFDNLFTAPLHGFKDTEDYWRRASAKPHLQQIRIPTLVVNARNDPFVPAHSLPVQADISPSVTLWQPAQGGHVGFPQGPFPGHVHAMPDAVGAWLAQHLGLPLQAHGAHAIQGENKVASTAGSSAVSEKARERESAKVHATGREATSQVLAHG